MKIYNSLTKRKEEFKPLNPPEVKMYACGITVSGDAHIGHAIQALIYDIVRKYLIKRGYIVKYARNYTDVDDKIIAKANEAGIDAREFAENMIKKIDKDMSDFGIDNADFTLKATDHIKDIIEFTKGLIEKGYAYVSDGDVYFSVEKDKSYGKLSGRNLEDAIAGTRKDIEENKNNPLDFALWKKAKPGEIYWESPWGKGRPGWHIECSVMNYKTFGEQIDIHGGGRDLVFPHHENEIAQTECFTGKPFAKYWTHNGLVKVNGVKMSKSLNNSITLRELLDKYDKEVIKFGLLQTNYKKDINITEDLFPKSKQHLIEFYTVLKDVESLGENTNLINSKIDEEFNEAMDDDFNTAKVLANLFTYFKDMKAKLSNNDFSVWGDYNAVIKSYGLLGLFQKGPDEFLKQNQENSKIDVPNNVLILAEKRWEAKQQKEFSKADEIRKEIENLGYVVVDKKGGYDINPR